MGKLTSLPFAVRRGARRKRKRAHPDRIHASLSPLPSPPFFFPAQSCKHHVSSIDAQPSTSGGILVFVTGQLLPEGESNPLKFSQAFHLAAAGGSYAVTNDVFRLNYA